MRRHRRPSGRGRDKNVEHLAIIYLNIERYRCLLRLPLTEMQDRAVRALLAEHLERLPVTLRPDEAPPPGESWWCPPWPPLPPVVEGV